jgi:hypothetical protein
MKVNIIKNKKIIIQGIKNSNDNKLDVDYPLMNWSNFFTLFAGLPGSGKTSMIINLLMSKKFKSYYKVFDKIYYFNSSIHTLPDKFLKLLNPERIYTSLNDLEQVLNECAESQEMSLIVIDDLVFELKDYQSALTRLAMNRRHLYCSIFLITQKINSVPLSIRGQIDSIFIWKKSLDNKKEKLALFDNYIADLDKDEFEFLVKLYSRKEADQHDFLYINKRENKYFYNFDEISFS